MNSAALLSNYNERTHTCKLAIYVANCVVMTFSRVWYLEVRVSAALETGAYNMDDESVNYTVYTLK